MRFDDFNQTELDEVEKKHKMKFDQCKADLNQLLLPEQTELEKHSHSKSFFVFVFVFDLSNYASFEKVLIYYEEISRLYNFKDKHKQILIGNKLDLAFNFQDSEKEIIKKFINDKELKYYEITTKMIFNFEIFYGSLFYTLFRDENKMFYDKFFMEGFNYVLNSKVTFSKSSRSSAKLSLVPGPAKYENPFELPTDSNNILY